MFVKEKLKIYENYGNKEKTIVRLVKGITAPASYLKAFPAIVGKVTKPVKRFPINQSVRIQGKPGEYIWRKAEFKSGLVKDLNGINNVPDLLKFGIAKYGNKPFHGVRPIFEEIEEKDNNGKTVKKLKMGDFEWKTYNQVYNLVIQLASYLLSAGYKEGSKIGIFADTQSEWLIFCLSVFMIRATAVTIYSTLTDESIVYALNLAECESILVDSKSLGRLSGLLGYISTIETIFCTSECSNVHFNDLKSKLQFQEVEKSERESKEHVIEKENVTSTNPPSNKQEEIESLPKTDKSMCEDVDRLWIKDIEVDEILLDAQTSAIRVLLKNRNAQNANTNEKKEEGEKEDTFQKEQVSGMKEDEKSSSDSCGSHSKSITKHEGEKHSLSTENEIKVDIPERVYKPKCITINFMYNEGKKLNMNDHFNNLKYSGDDIAVIMFTSGSTGVIIQQKNILSTVAAGLINDKIWNNMIYPAYLPLAHIFEFVCEIGTISKGGRIGYCRPLTLTDSSLMIGPDTKGDLTLLKPTVATFVPLMLERIKSGILEKVKERGMVAAAILQYGYNHKMKMRELGCDAPLVTKIVFKRVKQLTGGNLKFAISGGAPLPEYTEEFANISLGFPVKQGYGLTETCSAGTLGNINDSSVGNAGPPLPSVDLRLVAWEEGGYFPEDKPNPRGEIWLSGDSVTLGYYMRPDLTGEAYVVDPETKRRWFCTGDIGEHLPNGTFRIIDRKKDIIKLKHGEYVSLINVETAISKSKFVEMCCCIPNCESDFLVAVVVLSQNNLNRHVTENKLPSRDTLEQYINDSQLMDTVRAELLKNCTNFKLSKFETPKIFHFVLEQWTPESGLLTPSMKLKRAEITKFYKHLL